MSSGKQIKLNSHPFKPSENNKFSDTFRGKEIK